MKQKLLASEVFLIGVEAATIFAPSDAAFAKLPEGILESLTEGQKRAIVSRHIIGGKKVYIKYKLQKTMAI